MVKYSPNSRYLPIMSMEDKEVMKITSLSQSLVLSKGIRRDL